MLSIRLLGREEGSSDPDSDEPEGPFSYGRFTIGSTSERFIASLHYWHVEQYERSWLEELQLLLTGASDVALLFSNVTTDLAMQWYVQAYQLVVLPDGQFGGGERFWFPNWIPLGFDPLRPETLAPPGRRRRLFMVISLR